MHLYETFTFDYCNDSYSQKYNISQIFGYYIGGDPITVPKVFRVLMGVIVNGTKWKNGTCFTCTHGLMQDIFPSFAAALSPRLEKFFDSAKLQNGVCGTVGVDGTFVPLAEALMNDDFGMGSIFKSSNIRVIYELP